MRLSHTLCIVCALAIWPIVSVGTQDHSSADKHRASVMGFDQSRTTHHFSLFGDGGAIDVTVKDPADTVNQDAIRSHLPHIATMFATGNFEAPMLVHDSKNVPGTKVMSELKDRIRYTYVEIPAGGRVNIVASDREAIDAVHQFLRFQISEHKTGDSTVVRSR